MVTESSSVSADEVSRLAAVVRQLPCPFCHACDRPLEAAQLSWIESYWGFVCEQHWSIVVACEACLVRAATVTLRWTLRRGCWSLLGLLLAPIAVARSLAARRVQVGVEPSRWLLAFAYRYPEECRAAVAEAQASHLQVGVEPALVVALSSVALDRSQTSDPDSRASRAVSLEEKP
jgi:hypothetical protein